VCRQIPYASGGVDGVLGFFLFLFRLSLKLHVFDFEENLKTMSQCTGDFHLDLCIVKSEVFLLKKQFPPKPQLSYVDIHQTGDGLDDSNVKMHFDAETIQIVDKTGTFLTTREGIPQLTSRVNQSTHNDWSRDESCK
jgi:hypothetical protein